MFTFDDLARLTPQAVQVLLRSIEKDKLPIALKGASEKLRELFLSSMSERAGKMLREEIEALGPVQRARRGRGAGRDRAARQGTVRAGHDRDQQRQGRGADLLK